MKRLFVVVDYQNDFVSGSLGNDYSKSIENNIISLLDSVDLDSDNEKVIFTKDCHGDSYLHTREGKYLPIPHCLVSDNGYNLYGKVGEWFSKNFSADMEKITFLFLSFSLLGILSSCHRDNSAAIQESICFDTTDLSCELGMETAILLNDTLYVFSPRIFNFPGQEPNNTPQRMYGLNKQGEKLFEIDIDSLFHNYYYLFPVNNQLYASIPQKNGYKTYRFDPSKLEWILAEGVKPAPLFEDDNYIVTSSSSGEWGGTIFFTSKQDGKTYEGALLDPIRVLKKDGIYYASGALGHMRGHSMICAIEDPQKMAVFKNDRPTADSLIHLRESTSTQGLKMIADYGAYEKPTGDTVYTMQPALLLSSFLHKNNLYHMYADTAVHIFRINPASDSAVTDIQDPRIEVLYTFATPMDGSPWLKYSQTDYHQLFFRTSDGGAIIEITPDSIYLHTLINKK